jgi:hypothetical protein
LAFWHESDGWLYEVFPKNTPAADFGQFEAFKQLWDSKRDGDALPAWRDFTFEDFAPWYGWLVVEDIIPGPNYDSVFRLWGTHATTLFDYDMTGKRMSDVGEDLFSPADYTMSIEMARDHLIATATGPMNWQDRTFKTYSFLELPLADDGTTVDKFLTLLSEVITDK